MRSANEKDFINKEYKYLKILSFEGKNKNHKTIIKAICKCGKIKKYLLAHLKNGNTKSCGCFLAEKTGLMSRKHGMRNSPEYQIWCNMIQRCTNPNATYYENYGGRGIKICERWLIFENFFKDMGYCNGLEIDRKDNDGNYEIGNCHWATNKENNRNKRFKSDNSSGVRGIYWNKRLKKWNPIIGSDKNRLHLGSFSNFEDAHQEYLTYYFLIYGEYPPEFY